MAFDTIAGHIDSRRHGKFAMKAVDAVVAEKVFSNNGKPN
jgi:hypothetical protein